MITSQDIREKGFEKAVFGGYDMGQVDAFLEEIAIDIENIQKENVVLKSKMKVLVSKIEEYRTSEDALQMAIVSAQKMGCMIEKESKEKSEALIVTAQADAQRITREAQLEVEMELAKLSEAKRASAQFIENMRLLCQKQMDFLASVGESGFLKSEDVPVEESVEMSETVKSIDGTDCMKDGVIRAIDRRTVISVTKEQLCCLQFFFRAFESMCGQYCQAACHKTMPSSRMFL